MFTKSNKALKVLNKIAFLNTSNAFIPEAEGSNPTVTNLTK